MEVASKQQFDRDTPTTGNGPSLFGRDGLLDYFPSPSRPAGRSKLGFAGLRNCNINSFCCLENRDETGERTKIRIESVSRLCLFFGTLKAMLGGSFKREGNQGGGMGMYSCIYGGDCWVGKAVVAGNEKQVQIVSWEWFRRLLCWLAECSNVLVVTWDGGLGLVVVVVVLDEERFMVFLGLSSQFSQQQQQQLGGEGTRTNQLRLVS